MSRRRGGYYGGSTITHSEWFGRSSSEIEGDYVRTYTLYVQVEDETDYRVVLTTSNEDDFDTVYATLIAAGVKTRVEFDLKRKEV